MDDPIPGDVTVWIARLKAGDPAAARPLSDGYFARLVALARDHLRASPRAAADEEDVALSAFDSFYRGPARGTYFFRYDSIESSIASSHGVWCTGDISPVMIER